MIRLVAFLCCGVIAASATACSDGWVTGGPLQITASRSSGVAPLFVLFEGDLNPGQASQAPFHELDYQWDFDDSSSGSWGTSGDSRNEDFGPVVGHVFEQPGTYTVRLAVRGPEGELTTGEYQITVEDPNSTFAAQSTVCFSPSGNFAGCPSGAAQVTTGSLAEVENHVGGGKRLLLSRGESFTGSIRMTGSGTGILGAYGTGNRPVIGGTGALDLVTINSSDWRVMDLDLDASQRTGLAVGVALGDRYSNMTVLRVNVTGARRAFNVYGTGIAVVDSTASGFNGGSGGTGMYGAIANSAVLGNDIDLGGEYEHTVRLAHSTGVVIAHNILSNPPPTKHLLKMHAPTFGGSAENYSERVVIRRNTFVAGPQPNWLVALEAQNSTSDERLRDFIVDANHFVSGGATQTALVFQVQGISIRNNVFDMSFTPGDSPSCIGFTRFSSVPRSENVGIAHNTCYRATGSPRLVNNAGSYATAYIANNLVAAGGSPAVGVSSSDSPTIDGNITTGSPGFVSATPSNAVDFKLGAGSPAVDTGAATPAILRDFEGTLRPIGAAPDVGAFERP